MAKQRKPREHSRPLGRKRKDPSEKVQHMKAAERRPLVLRLRLQGYTPQQIAVRLQLRPSVVFKDLKVLFSAAAAQSAEKSQMREMQRMQLDTLWHALQDAIKNKDVKGISVGLRVLERKSKLFGLDMPTRSHVTVASEGNSWESLLSEPEGILGFGGEKK